MGINVGLLLLAVGIVAIVAMRLLHELADAQALARVEQAAVVGRQLIVAAHGDTLTSARLLSERPTLRRLLSEGDTPALGAYLSQFERTGGMDAVAVLRGGSVVARDGDALPARLSAAGPEQSTEVAANGTLLLVVRAPVAGAGAATVVATQRLDAEMARELSEQVGLQVTLHGRLDPSDPVAGLTAEALATGKPSGAQIGDSFRGVVLLPVSDAAPGVLEATLPAAGVLESMQRLVAMLLLLALGVALAAASASYLVARRLGRPLALLAAAATRMGHGDLGSPVPEIGDADVGALARTLEEMRRRLQRVTGDLRRERAEAEAIVGGIVEGVFAVDRHRRIRYLNPHAAALLGTTPEAALGRFCGDLLHPEPVAGALPCLAHCPIVHARFRGGARATEHLRLVGGRRTVVITSAPAVDERQMQVLRDETEVEASRRARDAILANISHEFRTPLSAQLASIELLLEQLPELDQAQIAHLVRSQQRGTLRLMSLIDNLLESARIEAGQSAIRRRPVALDEVVEEAVELVRPLLDQRSQAIEVDLSYPLPRVSGDAPRLTQALVNLLGNANKWAPAGSTITIGSAVRDGTVTLWVEDQGPGLPAAGGAELFRRWVRSQQDEPEQQGAGLGLWLVRSIVERHGGEVEARSTGSGARISLVLPVEHA